jgi:hypothetical protein
MYFFEIFISLLDYFLTGMRVNILRSFFYRERFGKLAV